MKQQRFTTALLNQHPSRKKQIIRWISENLLFAIASTIAILMIAATLLVVLATPPARALPSATDYYNNDVSEQISSEWERKAKAEWIAEFGDAQPNLTTESRVYLEQETARLQGLRNGN
mgnify:CR=1 FL=1